MANKTEQLSPVDPAVVKPNIPKNIIRARDSAMRQAETLDIQSADDYEAAFVLREQLQRFARTLTEILTPNIQRLFRAHKDATKERGDWVDPFLAADKIVERKRIAYNREQERIARERSEALTRQAREQQEQAAVNQAAELERVGEPEAAAAVLEMSATAPAPVVHVAPDTPKSKGSVAKKGWKWRFINPALIKPEFRMPNEKLIASQVKNMGKAAESIVGPGSILVEEDESENVRLSD